MRSFICLLASLLVASLHLAPASAQTLSNPLSALTQTGLLTSTYQTPVNVAITNLTQSTKSPITGQSVDVSFTAPANYLPQSAVSTLSGSQLDIQFILFATRPYATSQADTSQTGFTGGALYLDYVNPSTQQSLIDLGFDTQGTSTPYVTFRSLVCPTPACAYLCVRWDSLNQAYTIAGVAPPPAFPPVEGTLNCAVSSTPALITAQYVSITPPAVLTPPLVTPTPTAESSTAGADTVTLPTATTDASSSSTGSGLFIGVNMTSNSSTGTFNSTGFNSTLGNGTHVNGTHTNGTNSTVGLILPHASSTGSSSPNITAASNAPSSVQAWFAQHGYHLSSSQLKGGYIALIVIAALIGLLVPCLLCRHHHLKLKKTEAANRAALASKYIGAPAANANAGTASTDLAAMEAGHPQGQNTHRSTAETVAPTGAHSQEPSQAVDESNAYTYVHDYKSIMVPNQNYQQTQRTLGSDAHNVMFVMNE